MKRTLLKCIQAGLAAIVIMSAIAYFWPHNNMASGIGLVICFGIGVINGFRP